MESVKSSTSSSSDAPPRILKTWWNTFNGLNEELRPTIVRVEATGDLSAILQQAVVTVPRNRTGLDPQRVNWRVTCVSANGRDVLKAAELFVGGEMSGRTCGENDMWAVPEDVNKKNKPVPKTSAFFDRDGCIYVVDAGLCPCLRCCKSFAGLAEFTRSTIIVRPLTDYEIIASGRTPLATTSIYLLVFSSAGTFTLFNNVIAKPVEYGSARYICSGKDEHAFTVLFPDTASMNRAIKRSSISAGLGSSLEYPVFRCPECRPTRDDPFQKLVFDDKSTVLPRGSYKLEELRRWGGL